MSVRGTALRMALAVFRSAGEKAAASRRRSIVSNMPVMFSLGPVRRWSLPCPVMTIFYKKCILNWGRRPLLKMDRRTAFILLALLACAALLRFCCLGGRGFLIWDEAYYALEGRTVPAAVSYLAGGGGAGGLKDRLVSGGCVVPTGTGKPGFMLLLSAWGLAFGTGDTAGLALPAFVGVLCVWLVFWAAYRCAGAAAGLTAAFLLAFSGLHIWYSRALMGNAIAAFFLLLGLLAYFRAYRSGGGPGAKRLYFAAGAVTGFAFLVHYALLPNLAVLGVCEAFRLWEGRARLKAGLLETLAAAAGFTLVLLSAEAVYAAVYGVFSGGLEGITHRTYFQYLVRQFLWSAPSGLGIGWSWKLYLGGLADFCGRPGAAVILGAMAASVYVFFRNREFAARVLILQAIGTLLFWTLNPGIAALRAFSAFAPLSAAAAGISVSWLLAGAGARLRTAAYGCMAAAVLWGAYGSVPEMLSARSVFPEAAAWLSARGEKGPVSVLEWPFLQFYLGSKIVANQDRVKEWRHVEEAAAAGARYLVVTNTETDWLKERGGGLSEGLLRMMAKGAPEAAWKVGAGARFMAYDGLRYPQHISEVSIYPLPARPAKH